MKKNEVKIGETYRVKVSGALTVVRITEAHRNGGWVGVNINSKRQVRIKTAARLRGKASLGGPSKGRKIVTKAEYEAEAKVERTARGELGGTAKKATRTAKVATKRDPGERGAKKKRLSGLDAAAKVLADAAEPMGTTVLVEKMLAKGLWSTKGKTPAATIYAAIVRDIQKHGDASRFQKTERGKFALRKGA